MNKIGSFGNVQARLRQHIAATNKSASLPTEQAIAKETSISLPSSDPEVKESLPSAGVPASPKPDLTDTGVEAGQSMPGANLNPPTEEKNRKETSPSSKLAASSEISEIQTRLAEGLKKLAAEIKTSSDNTVTSLGEKQENPDGSLGNGTKADTSGATPKVEGVTGVTQTDPGGSPKAPGPQGPSESSVKVAEDGSVTISSPSIKTEKSQIKEEKVKLASGEEVQINLDALGQKVAEYSQDVMAGRAMAHEIIGLINGIGSPEFSDRHKLAEAVHANTMVSTIQGLVGAGLEAQIITQKQADSLMELAGFTQNPLFSAIKNVQEKMAALDEAKFTKEQKIAFVEKLASPEEAMAAAGGAPPPVDPAAMQGAIGELLAQLEQAVQSGQITEEQALQILQENGVPIDQILGSAGAAPAGAAPAGDPAAIDPAAAAPSIGGDPAVIAPPTPSPASAPEAPKPDSAPSKEEPKSEEKKEEGSKSEEKGESKSEEKKEESSEEKSASLRRGLEQKLGSFVLAARSLKKANLDKLPLDPAPQLPVAPPDALTKPMKLPESMIPAAPAPAAAPAAAPAPEPSGLFPTIASALKDPNVLKALFAGGGLATAGLAAYHLTKDDEEKKKKVAEADPMAAAGAMGDPAAGAVGDPAAGAGAPTVQEILADVEAALQSGAITPEQAQEIVQLLSAELGAGGGAPVADPAAAPVA